MNKKLAMVVLLLAVGAMALAQEVKIGGTIEGNTIVTPWVEISAKVAVPNVLLWGEARGTFNPLTNPEDLTFKEAKVTFGMEVYLGWKGPGVGIQQELTYTDEVVVTPKLEVFLSVGRRTFP